MKNRKRHPKDYAVEKTIQTIRVIEALEGTNFEPVTVAKLLERTGEIPEVKNQLKLDSINRILATLELLGWARQNEKGLWHLDAKVLRLSQRYSEIYMTVISK